MANALLAATPCEALESLSLPDTTITTAQMVPRGPFTPPVLPGVPPPPIDPGRGPQTTAGRGQAAPEPLILSAHCRVAAVLRPSHDSEIGFEVWMPAESWNGKFQAVGNSGWGGIISYPAMALALQEGYATASTDTGHKGANALFAIGHPEKLTDFAYRAVHELAVKSKAIIAAFYGRAPRLSYWTGCSTGGRQGLMAAQRYADDFDGIVAGAPVNNQTHLVLWDLYVASPPAKDRAAAVPPAKLALVNRAALATCDARDGVRDGLINDPPRCRFDPSVLLCQGADGENCLTRAQLESINRAYAPTKTTMGDLVFSGMAPGSESSWNFLSGAQPIAVTLGSAQVAYDDANWDWRTFDLDRDAKVLDKKVGAIVDAVSPDLRAFKARRGKLLIYHGWNDTAVPAGNSVNYYTSVLAYMGRRQDDWIRLFMAPGMQHCGNGPGPNQVNYVAALERWRESGIAPEQLIASRVTNTRVDMTRPLCPYPQVARYKGVGTTNDAGNFVCRAP